jgi:hypothetical protein
MKICRFDKSKRCFHSSCSWLESSSGKVVLCPLYCGGDKFTPRSVKPVLVSVFSKHLRGGR